MKRSEMVLKIAEFLIEPRYPDDPVEEANVILSRLEKAGMLPPMCARGFDRDGLSSKTPPSNKWEPEQDNYEPLPWDGSRSGAV